MRLPAFAFAIVLAACSQASAASLHDVVRNALANYPAILVAQSNRSVARYDVERARALHYPTVDVLGTRRLAGAAQNLAQPRLRVNVWASGAIDATIEREGLREGALASRELETREDVAFDAAQSYLRLLRGVRTLEATQRNLERHEALVKDFEAIATIDVGRRYDLVQARTRLEQVRLQIAEREAEIASARESLARYFPTSIPVAELSLPPELREPAPGAAQTALVGHPAIEAAQREVLVAEANTRVTRAERMPRVDVNTVTFELGSWDVDPDQAQRLQIIADAIRRAIARNPREVFLIEGHTDAVGSDIDNLSLSDRRAENVAQVLSEQFGVPPENLTTQGYGEQYLKIPTQGPERANRRVTVRRITPLLAGGNPPPPPPPR